MLVQVRAEEISIKTADFLTVKHGPNKSAKILQSTDKRTSRVVAHVVYHAIRRGDVDENQEVPIPAPFRSCSSIAAIQHPFLSWFDIGRGATETVSRRLVLTWRRINIAATQITSRQIPRIARSQTVAS